MLADDMIWEFLPKGLKDVFKIVNVERQSSAFHVWLDELRQKSYEDRHNHSIVGKGYTEYCTIQDMPIRGLPTMLHMRKCKWLDKDTGEIFSYDIDYYDEDGTFKGSRQMLDAASKSPNCTGWTYTPWAHHRDLLENFVDLANAYRPVTQVGE